MTTSILCPSGHRHMLPVLTADCWTEGSEPRAVLVTRREFDVANELLRDGAPNQTIAKRLYVSEDTVKTHVKGLLLRTGAKTRTDLVVAVFRGRVRLIPVNVAASVMHSASREVLVR